MRCKRNGALIKLAFASFKSHATRTCTPSPNSESRLANALGGQSMSQQSMRCEKASISLSTK